LGDPAARALAAVDDAPTLGDVVGFCKPAAGRNGES